MHICYLYYEIHVATSFMEMQTGILGALGLDKTLFN